MQTRIILAEGFMSFQLGTDCERQTEVRNRNKFVCWWDCIITKRAKTEKFKFLEADTARYSSPKGTF